ncbi:MAG: Gfo/Idh/MocA family oxidoreductase [Planctomycetota bacterium]
MDIVRFGVVGLGVIGRRRARQITETDNAVLEGACDTDEKQLKNAAEELNCKTFSSYEEMLEDVSINVVYLITPPMTHLELIDKAAKAGKHVIVTKPMETNVERSRRIIEICRLQNMSLIVDYEMRYMPALQQWKGAVDAGEFGDIVFAEARCKWWREQSYFDERKWRGFWESAGGGALAIQGIHVVDLLVWLCGDVKVVTARCGTFSHAVEVDDITVALLEMPNGRPATITATINHHLDDEFGVAISGTLGSASNLRGERPVVKFKAEGCEKLKTPRGDWPRSAAEDMVMVLREGRKPYVPGEEGIRSIKLMEDIYKAAGVRR